MTIRKKLLTTLTAAAAAASVMGTTAFAAVTTPQEYVQANNKALVWFNSQYIIGLSPVSYAEEMDKALTGRPARTETQTMIVADSDGQTQTTTTYYGFTYDDAGRLTRRFEADSQADALAFKAGDKYIDFSYDANGSVAAEYSYQEDGSRSGGRDQIYSYNEAGQAAVMAFPGNGTYTWQTAFTYDDNGCIAGSEFVEVRNEDGHVNADDKMNFTYQNNLLTAIAYDTATTQTSYTLTYDENSRITGGVGNVEDVNGNAGPRYYQITYNDDGTIAASYDLRQLTDTGRQVLVTTVYTY